MKLKSLFSFAVKDIFSSKKFALFFALNLSLGLFGFLTLDTFKISIENSMSQKSKNILGADVGIGARRLLSPEELKIADEVFEGYLDKSQVIESFSMIAAANNSRLVEVKAIQDNFPFYGELELQVQGLLTPETKSRDLFTGQKAWVYPEVLLQLGLKIGDKVKLGEIEVEISDVVLKDSSGAGAGFAFASPFYVSRETFEKTKLLSFGSTLYQSQLYKMPESADLATLVSQASAKITDPAVQVLFHKTASAQVARLLNRLNDYLGLASLVALFLTALGTTFLYRSHLTKRLKDVAIMKSLGFSVGQIRQLYLLQLLFLGTLATVPVLILSAASMAPLGMWISRELQTELNLHFTLRTVGLGFFSGLLLCILICYPLILSLKSVKPRQLFQGIEFQDSRFSWQQLLNYIPAFIFFWGMSVWLAKSWIVSSLFLALFIASFLILMVCGLAFLQLLDRIRVKNLALRMALRNLARQKFSSISIFIAIAIGSLFMNLIPQIKSSLDAELESPTSNKLPSLFLFDIQEDQVEPLKQELQKMETGLLYVSPMIQARLNKVNQQAFEKSDRNEESFTREQENENRFRNRGFNLSYRQGLSDSESITAGKEIIGTYDPNSHTLPLISLEKEFAKRLDLKIGDELEFEIQGVMISGVVANLRKVKWTSFQPNFFVLFQDGAINEAPKTFLAGIPGLSAVKKSEVQNGLVKAFPNVSAIDVSQLIERISEIIGQMSLAISAMAGLSILIGLAILFAIANQKSIERRKEINLLKVLGAPFGFIGGVFYYEFILLTILASTLGIFLSFICHFILIKIVFESEMSFHIQTPLLLLLANIILTFTVSWLAIRSVLKEKPKRILSEI